jgi:hypothetical protein
MKININPTKIIVVMILIPLSLFAKSNEHLLSDIKIFFKNSPVAYRLKAFDNVENNSSQKALKESFEKLLPKYLESEELFSKEACQTDASSNIALPYSDFFRLLQLYTDYLKENASKDEYLELLDKSLGNFHTLMANSDNLIDYMISLNHMHQLLMSLHCSDEVIARVKKYPPQNPELLFEKLELDKERTLALWREKGMSEGEKMYNPEMLKRIHKEVSMDFEKILTQMSKLERVAIEDGTIESLTRYKNYVKTVTDLSRHNGIWENLKYKGSVYLMRALDFLGIESDFRGTTTDRVVALLLAIMVPNRVDMDRKSYEQHRALVEQYERLLEGCPQKY